MLVRIVSPRWDDATQRWQQPGEVITIRDAQWETEFACYSHHAVRVEAAAPAAVPDVSAAVEVVASPAVPESVPEPAVQVAPSDKMSRKRQTK